jgi:hypothetical protein
MVTKTDQAASAALPTLEDMDKASEKGWEAFTKFLAGNVAVTVVVLVLIALLTVWR